jgi:hypothetical protein
MAEMVRAPERGWGAGKRRPNRLCQLGGWGKGRTPSGERTGIA